MAKGKIDATKKKKIKDMVLGVVKRIDTGKMENYKYYEKLLNSMTDKQFEEWANTMGHDLDDTIQIFQLPFSEMSLKQIQDAAKFLDLPLEEYVYYRHNDPDGVRTKVKVPVGYVHIKRTQQLLSKKNRYAFDSDDTNLKTGQVVGDSKVAAISDSETFFLTSINADKALEEFLGPRSDNQYKKDQMYQQISRDGFASMDNMEDDISKHTTLNTVDAYFLASGLKTDIISKSLKTNYTIKQQLRDKDGK